MFGVQYNNVISLSLAECVATPLHSWLLRKLQLSMRTLRERLLLLLLLVLCLLLLFLLLPLLL